MKKAVVFSFILALLLCCGTVYAAPEASASPSATPEPAATRAPTYTPSPLNPTPFSGLIGLNAATNATSEDVVRVQIRLRDLGYFNFKPTGSFKSMTADAAKAFQQKNTTLDGQPMISDGSIGPQTMESLFSYAAIRVDIAASIPIGKALSGTPTVTGELVAWPQVKTMLTVGTEYPLTDYNTGTSFTMAFTGGQNHAEMECSNAYAASVYKELFGGEYNYSKRPVVVTIGGQKIAASLQGYPHGEDQYAGNDMDGHACLFFDGSLSHVGSLPDTEHQSFVYTAAGRG